MHDFGTRIRPEEITPELREQLIGDCRLSEILLHTAAFLGVVAVSLLLSLVYRWHQEPWGSEWRPIVFAVMVGVLVMIGIRMWFHWENRFLKNAPAAPAEVEEIDVTADHKHYLKLKFDPASAPGTPSHEGEVTAELHTDAPAFNEQLHTGDLVSVIYEPSNPEHVEVVEVEHEHPVGAK
ncbi:MAG: hypothetical protein ROO76_16580 [Terriglobia bacterium]|jgi:cytoskeletal protein RodZ|nr:hypothetical protein [Terriglobia bacterium]